jgi:hypothetical protein
LSILSDRNANAFGSSDDTPSEPMDGVCLGMIKDIARLLMLNAPGIHNV